MLWFVGLGLDGHKSLSNRIEKLLREADIVYLEQFTSPLPNSEPSRLRQKTTGEFVIAKRWFVEDGMEIIKNAKKKIVVLLSYGDPFMATTHIELRTRAIYQKIKTKVIHGASAITSIVGECGLHFYKMGNVVTVMKDPKTTTTAYNIIHKNLILGNHTLLLLEYSQDSNFFLDPKEAFCNLFLIEKEQRRKILNQSTFVLVASRIGLPNQSIISGKISSLKKIDFGKPPHAIIIPGTMHFTEVDAIKIMSKCLDKPYDNSDKTKKISSQMIIKYVPLVRNALSVITPIYKNSEFQIVLENAELYINDAQEFLAKGKDELAVLSIGYADGLVDALRMAKGLET